MERSNNSKRDDFRSAAIQALKNLEREHEERLEQKELRKAEKEKKQKKWVVCQWIIIIICTAIVIFQVPKVISAFRQGEKPLRHGTYATDKRTDECISNLWKISGLLQRGKMVTNNILDPAGNKPYVVRRTKNDVIISCPNPKLHGFRDIRISKKNPVPELIK